MAVLIVSLVLASVASNTEGALSLVLWILAAGSLAFAIYLRTPPGRAASARRLARARDGAASEHGDKQRLTKPKPSKLLPLGRTDEDQGIPQQSKANLKPWNRPRDADSEIRGDDGT